MSGMFILPILQGHDGEQVPGTDTPEHADSAAHEAFDHEAVDKPQPYFPARDDDSAADTPAQ